MAYSVYIARPPIGGGYPPGTYKIGMTTETSVMDRIEALNDVGSNYPTANGANWSRHDQFEFETAEQMEAFEASMMQHLDVGFDPLGTGAMELFQSSNLEADIADATSHALKDLVELGHINPTEIARAAEASGIAPPGSAAEFADLAGLSPEVTELVLDKSTDWLFELLVAGTGIGGVAIAVWRGRRLYRWATRLWKQSEAEARKADPPRSPESSEVTLAREDYLEFRRQSK